MNIEFDNRQLKVVPISVKYIDAFAEMLEEYRLYQEHYLPYYGKLGDWFNTLEEYVIFWEKCVVAPLPALNIVRTNSFWLFEGQRILGDVRFRHSLNEQLERDGGNIGYCVRPTQRNQGLATVLLDFALKYAHNCGLSRALITCERGNQASIRVVEKCGGVQTTDSITSDGAINFRYWVNLNGYGDGVLI